MSDRSAMSVELGGVLPTGKTYRELLELAGGLHAGDWDGGQGEDAAREEFETAAKFGRAALFFHADAVGGLCQELTDFCQQHGIAYHRADDGHYAYGATHSAWYPGLAQSLEAAGNIEDGPSLPLSAILDVRKSGKLDELLDQWRAAIQVPAVIIPPKPARRLQP
jgi:hypothetical protein